MRLFLIFSSVQFNLYSTINKPVLQKSERNILLLMDYFFLFRLIYLLIYCCANLNTKKNDYLKNLWDIIWNAMI